MKFVDIGYIVTRPSGTKEYIFPRELFSVRVERGRVYLDFYKDGANITMNVPIEAVELVDVRDD